MILHVASAEDDQWRYKRRETITIAATLAIVYDAMMEVKSFKRKKERKKKWGEVCENEAEKSRITRDEVNRENNSGGEGEIKENRFSLDFS